MARDDNADITEAKRLRQLEKNLNAEAKAKLQEFWDSEGEDLFGSTTSPLADKSEGELDQLFGQFADDEMSEIVARNIGKKK